MHHYGSQRFFTNAAFANARMAIFMGTEGAGLGAKTIAGCDRAVRIPMAHGVDSLNVAAASAVAFWQLCPHVSNEYHYQPGLYH